MRDRYTLEIVLEDSEDEFSEDFNPKNQKDITNLEVSIQESLVLEGWSCSSVQLKKTEII